MGPVQKNQSTSLQALPADSARIVVANGHPVLAMPVSWKGTLQQYAGRLHRQQAGKTSVRIIDWLDIGHPIPQWM
jgi:hypothetical protein